VIVECQKCGAPLSVVEGQRLAQCSYCGASSQVRSMRTAAVQTPPGWQPPAQWQPPPQGFGPPPPPYVYRPPPAPAPGGGGAGVVAVMVAFGAIAAVGGVVAALVGAGGGSVFATRVDPNARPTVATVPVGAAPLSRSISGVAGGSIRGGSIDTRCRGYFPVAPQFAIQVTAPQQVRLTTLASDDLTMALRDPSGTWRCDDDGGSGNSPLLDVPLAPGVYPVWIGTYRQRLSSSFSLQVQAGPPGALPFASELAYNAPPTLGVVPLAGPGTSSSQAGFAGGPFAASGLRGDCRGHLPVAPHLVLRTTGYRRVTLTTASTRDLTMVVRDASGALHCDDDSGGAMQPRIAVTLPPGDQQVWVGTYSAGETVPFTLTTASEPGAATAMAGGLAPQARPTVATLDLDRGPATTTNRGIIFGTVEARAVSPSCTGYLTTAPQLRLLTRTPRHVTIAVTSSADTTLLARGPNGDMVCADDSRGSSNPLIDADIGAGETTVWIGSYAPSRRAGFRVQVTAQAPSGALPVK